MDPVTAIGLCASIVQLIDATSRVIKYASEVKDAPSRRENLSLEAANLMPLLMRLKQRISSAAPNEQWFSGVRLLGVPGGPIPELEKVVGQLGDRLKTRKKRRGGDLLWPSDEKDCIAILSKIERMKALIGLALQDDQFRLMLALKEDSGTMMENVEVISNNVARLGIDQRSDRDQQILDWLSRQTFGERQKDVLKQMTPGTGSWILQTPGFQSFLADNSKMLWCPGMNGAGKTVLTSFIVDHLETVFLNRNIGIAFVYCNYKELDQTAENLTASLLRQLVQSKPVLPDQISDLYNKHYTRQTRPSLAETIPLIRGIAQTYSKTFVLIDALDEYREQDGTHDTLINALHELHPDVHLLVTSRYVPFIESEFDDAMKVEVRASDENIAAYIRSQVVGARRFQRIIGEDAGLQSNIIEVITKNCQGMFLMAKLHMDSLKSQRDRRSVRLTLEKLPAKLDEAYDQTLDRIKE